MAGIFDMVTGIVNKVLNPAKEVFDEVHLSAEERRKFEQATLELEYELTKFMLEKETEVLRLQAGVVEAEAKGESFIQRAWRPILMLSLVAILINNYILAPYLSVLFNFSVMLDIPADMWDLMTFGVSGYIGGRTIEKVAPHVKDAVAIYQQGKKENG